jgi:peptide-methionine (S)-S-oxide reductase
MESTMALNPLKPTSPNSRWLQGALVAAASLIAVAGVFSVSHSSAEEARAIPPPTLDEPVAQNVHSETAVFSGGCFWGVQGVFQHVSGVTEAISGYAGGKQADAHYNTVSTGTTGHAESVRVTFDPSKVSYGRLLQIYFSVAHDPTELDRQGPDSGTQYRSTIFPTSGEQAKVAKAYIAQLDAAHVFSRPIVTTIEPGRTFYPAENYHQNFLALNPTYPYIVINDLPKVASLKRLYPKAYRDAPVLVAVAKTSN